MPLRYPFLPKKTLITPRKTDNAPRNPHPAHATERETGECSLIFRRLLMGLR
ncbi:MAG: hypothetical protein IKP91_10880 [Bacteroidaceae bacterium]|nr:hypothetical protein [Bacteroidaceae bacterium]